MNWLVLESLAHFTLKPKESIVIIETLLLREQRYALMLQNEAQKIQAIELQKYVTPQSEKLI